MSLENALKDFLNKTDFVRFDTFFTGFMLRSEEHTSELQSRE